MQNYKSDRKLDKSYFGHESESECSTQDRLDLNFKENFKNLDELLQLENQFY